MSKRPNEIFKKINPKGGFFPVSDPNGRPEKPTIVDFKDLGFDASDFVGVHRIGAIKYGAAFQDNIASLWMKEIHSGFEAELGDAQTIFQVPQIGPVIGGKPYQAAYGPQDSYYPDNSDPNGDYGLIISYANTKPPNYKLKHEILNNLDSHNDDADVEQGFTPSDPKNLPKPSDPVRSVFPYSKASPRDKYRGWYENDVWIPKFSMFHGRPKDQNHPLGKHNGIDIFAPYGTPIISPINGVLRLNPFVGGPNNPTLGRTAVVEFIYQEQPHFAVFAHLSKNFGNEGDLVFAGVTALGETGDSGNAQLGGNPYDFNSRNSYGGRSDHVHIDVRKKLAAKYDDFVDPTLALGLSVGLP